MKSRNINKLKPKKFLSIGRHDLPHVGDLTKPYFVVAGCSFTAGTGLDYKNTWPSILGEKLGLQHINIALEGSSMEYQYDKISEAEKTLTEAKFIVWMQTYPVRTHRNKVLSFLLGDLKARVMINEQLFRKPDHLMEQWNKIKKYNDLVKDKNIYIVNCWYWDKKLLHLFKHKICKNNTRCILNELMQVDDAQFDSHPGVESNKMIAEKIYSHICSFNPVLEKNK